MRKARITLWLEKLVPAKAGLRIGEKFPNFKDPFRTILQVIAAPNTPLLYEFGNRIGGSLTPRLYTGAVKPIVRCIGDVELLKYSEFS